MKDDNNDDFYDEDSIDEDEIDEHEYEITAAPVESINWRRIEILKERMWLKEQNEDFSDWY